MNGVLQDVVDCPATSPGPRRRQSREALLRPEFAYLYPSLKSGEWASAAILADRVLAASLIRGSDSALRGRMLLDTHFEFRGGESDAGEREGVRFRRAATGGAPRTAPEPAR
jgi:hypothetical protein